MEVSLIIERTYDVDLIKSVYFIDEIWDAVTEDGAEREYFEPNLQDTAWITIEEKGLLGLYAFDFIDSETMRVHPMVIPDKRKRSYEILKSMINWFIKTQDCKRLIAEVPRLYKHVRLFAVRAGFIQQSIQPKCHLKNGILGDVFLYSITRDKLER